MTAGRESSSRCSLNDRLRGSAPLPAGDRAALACAGRGVAAAVSGPRCRSQSE